MGAAFSAAAWFACELGMRAHTAILLLLRARGRRWTRESRVVRREIEQTTRSIRGRAPWSFCNTYFRLELAWPGPWASRSAVTLQLKQFIPFAKLIQLGGTASTALRCGIFAVYVGRPFDSGFGFGGTVTKDFVPVRQKGQRVYRNILATQIARSTRGRALGVVKYFFAALGLRAYNTPRAFLIRLAFFHGYGLCPSRDALCLPIMRFKPTAVLPRLVQGHGLPFDSGSGLISALGYFFPNERCTRTTYL
ncbi:hypothetical protein B0H14DRAFT_2591456 [Mycena olivaceomarginata]|nr:hypothetical protein B0H14DRAFT_2591456 [Mycena olivaceomarginata]